MSLLYFFTLLLGLCGLFLDWLKLRQHCEHAFNGFARADLRFASRLKLPRHILGELSVPSVSRFTWQNKINALCSIKKNPHFKWIFTKDNLFFLKLSFVLYLQTKMYILEVINWFILQFPQPLHPHETKKVNAFYCYDNKYMYRERVILLVFRM